MTIKIDTSDTNNIYEANIEFRFIFLILYYIKFTCLIYRYCEDDQQDPRAIPWDPEKRSTEVFKVK